MKQTLKEISEREINQKFKQIMLAQSETSIDIDKQVEELKIKLWEIEENHHYQVYVILKEILKLRRLQISGYEKRMLARERNIPYTREQIHYFFMFDYMSDNTRDKIENGKLKASTYLSVIRRDIRYRDPEIQDQLLEALTDEKITMDDVANSTSYTLLRKVNAIKPMKEDDKITLETIYASVRLKKKLETHMVSLLKSNHKEKLIRKLESLQETVIRIINSNKEEKKDGGINFTQKPSVSAPNGVVELGLNGSANATPKDCKHTNTFMTLKDEEKCMDCGYIYPKKCLQYFYGTKEEYCEANPNDDWYCY